MRVLSYIAVPLAGLLVSVSAQSTLSLTQCGNYCQIDQVLGPKLSSSASIAHPRTAIARWSDYDPLRPGTVVNVATEKDVLLTVSLSANLEAFLGAVYSLVVGTILHRKENQIFRSKRGQCLGHHIQHWPEPCGHQPSRYPGDHIQ